MLPFDNRYINKAIRTLPQSPSVTASCLRAHVCRSDYTYNMVVLFVQSELISPNLAIFLWNAPRGLTVHRTVIQDPRFRVATSRRKAYVRAISLLIVGSGICPIWRGVTCTLYILCLIFSQAYDIIKKKGG